MKRMLIVDDERIEREGIIMLVESMKKDIEILQASNGKKALQTLKERKVDILLTDIKMPFMTGLELIKVAKELVPDLQIAIFSGFGEFAYAQEAIKYGVTDYILKPVDPVRFKKTLEMMLEACESKEREKEQKEKDSSFFGRYLLQKYLFTGKSEYLEKLVVKGKDHAKSASVANIQNIMLLDAVENFFEEHSSDVINGLEQHLGRKIEYLDLNVNQILLIFYQSASDNYARIAGDVQEYIARQFGMECFVAVSRKINDLRECPKAYQELENLMEKKFYHYDTHVFLIDEEAAEVGVGTGDIDYQKRLKEDIRLKDFTHLWEDYWKMKEQIQKNGMDSQMYIKFIYSELVKELYVGMEMSGTRQMMGVIEKIYQAANLNAICQHVEQCIRDFEEKNAQSDAGVRSDVDKVKKYISGHYGEELSTDKLAGQVYLSPGYLSYIFKKETGMNLSRYIKECRMERAKELLKETNMKIVQICKEVGFTNVSYFCQSFREYCGISPEKFRKGEAVDEEMV